MAALRCSRAALLTRFDTGMASSASATTPEWPAKRRGTPWSVSSSTRMSLRWNRVASRRTPTGSWRTRRASMADSMNAAAPSGSRSIAEEISTSRRAGAKDGGAPERSPGMTSGIASSRCCASVAAGRSPVAARMLSELKASLGSASTTVWRTKSWTARSISGPLSRPGPPSSA